MTFYKKILVLKQIEAGFSGADKPISAICRIEIEGGVAELFLTVVNAPLIDNTYYKFMLVDNDGVTHLFDLGRKPTAEKFVFSIFPSVKKGVSAGLYAVNDDIPITVAFAVEDDSKCSLTEFKRLVAENCLRERERTLKQKGKDSEPVIEDPAPVKPPYPLPPEPNPNQTPEKEFPSPKSDTVKLFYDDEAVATTNFYEFDQELEQKLFAVKEASDDILRIPNERTFSPRQEETDFIKSPSDFFKNETDADCGEEFSKERPYYQTVQEDLNKIFDKFPKDDRLKGLFPKSRWAKINYAADKYYIVGVIKERSKEKYICYGVPATYSRTPPKELKGYCTFIPLSIFDLSGDGFWMMFQDAVTGDCIKPKPPFD